MVDDQSTDHGRSLLGWLAVTGQFLAIAGVIFAPSPGWPSGWTWLSWVGVAMVVLGAAVGVAAMLNLGRALTPNPVPLPGAALRTDALYSRVRHPIYAALLVLTAGLLLRAPSWLGLVSMTALTLILTAKAVWEERMLVEDHPQYADYRKHTGRFFPRLIRTHGTD